MAKFTKTLSGDDRYSVILEVEETSTSIANNTSNVKYTLKAKKSKGTGYYSGSASSPIKVKLDGETIVDKKVAYDFSTSTSQEKTITLATGTETIVHDPDGTKTISCSGYFKDGGGNGLGSGTASGNLTLTSLHKGPEPTIVGTQYYNPTGFVTGQILIDNITVLRVQPSATTYDSALITSYDITCGGVQAVNNTLNFIDNPPTTWVIQVIATDSYGAKGIYSRGVNGVEYTKPTLNGSTLKAKRQGQLTGNVSLTASGTYFNGTGLNQAITPVVKYSAKRVDNDEVLIPETTATSIVYSDGTWTIDESISGFDYRYSYQIEVKITDNLITARNNDLPSISGVTINPVTIPTYTTIIPVGEPTWVEYRDRVDFKRLTRQKGEVYGETELYYDADGTNGNVTLEETCENFEYVEIFYYTNSGNYYGSSKIYLPNGKKAQLKAENDDGTYNYMYTANYTFNGTTLTRNTEYRWRLAGSGSSNRASTSTIYIYRVIGYK